MLKVFSRLRLAKQQQIGVLIFIIFLEALSGAYVWISFRPPAAFGFLVKDGEGYVLAWKSESNDYQTRSYSSLEAALAFANNALKLETSHNPVSNDELERVWMQDRSGAYIMFWKTLRVDYLNQMTFHKEADADFFLHAFRSGEYTPSPFGHSIFMRPVLEQ